MNVQEIMQREFAACAPTDDLTVPIAVMKQHRCGFVPVVDDGGHLTGVVTDRDVCIGLGRSPKSPPSRVAVSDVMSHPVYSCFADENVKVVLATMAKHHVRRLPVVTREGHLEGVLSIDDVLHAPPRRDAPIAEEIVAALRGIGTPDEVSSFVQ